MRLEQAELALWLSWVQAAAAAPGAPAPSRVDLGAAAGAFGWAALPGDTLFNRAIGLGVAAAATGDQVDAALAFFRHLGVPGAIDLVPGARPADLAEWLASRGLRPVMHLTVLARRLGAPLPPARPAPGVTVAAVGAGEALAFAQAYATGFAAPDRARASLVPLVAALVGRPGWDAYVARVDQEPVGAALLYRTGDMAVLAGCGVHPAQRGLGIQGALARRRLLDAAAAGCRVACTQTGAATPSERNMERLGLAVAYRKALWAPVKG